MAISGAKSEPDVDSELPGESAPSGPRRAHRIVGTQRPDERRVYMDQSQKGPEWKSRLTMGVKVLTLGVAIDADVGVQASYVASPKTRMNRESAVPRCSAVQVQIDSRRDM